MDTLNIQEASRTDSEQEADFSDPHQDVEINDNEEAYPSRPTSRLGFNRSTLAEKPSEAPEGSEAIQWSRSLFQSVGIPGLRLSSIKTHTASTSELMAAAISASSTSPDSEPHGVAYPYSEDQTLTSSSNIAAQDFVKSSIVPFKSPPSSPPPVSRLCFPFVTTPSPRRDKVPPVRPPTRHKYSCNPSSMSPVPAVRPSPSHQRHNYREHGYSRLALQNVKWFWSMREDEWDTYNTDLQNIGVVARLPNLEPGKHVAASRPTAHQCLPPMTIHPRRGDIPALRDPYCLHIDRCFVSLPTWTIGKTLWMYDVHMALEERKVQTLNKADEDTSDGESESEMDTSASTGCSDDSDSTLVESESESDLLQYSKLAISPTSKLDDIWEDQDQEFTQSSSLVLSGVRVSHLSPGQHFSDKSSWSQFVYINNPKTKDSGDKTPSWATNWYRRWDLLVDLSRRNRNREHALFESSAPPLELSPADKDTSATRLYS
ncbi:hypothetical protein B0H34DRAFT_375989 [Crassisporium funariophilum]|nr:hypothetical protein B0H34DRAFT_375989 [Crassisporium funariophilum]